MSQKTIRALAGHALRAMLARYSHICAAAKRAAISALEQGEQSRDEAASLSGQCPDVIRNNKRDSSACCSLKNRED